MPDVEIKILIDDEQLNPLIESAGSLSSEFVKGFEVIGSTAEATFVRFNRVGEDNLRKTKSTFDQLYGGDDLQSVLLRGLMVVPPFDLIEPSLDFSDDINKIIGDQIDSILNNTVVTDILSSQPPKPQPSRPNIPSNSTELLEFILPRPGEQVVNTDELLELVRQQFQSDINLLANQKGVEVPVLKVKIQSLQPDKLPELDSTDFKDVVSPLSLSKQIKAENDEQFRTIAEIGLIINDLEKQYISARESILAQKTATDEATASQMLQAESAGFLKSELQDVKAITNDYTFDGVMPLKENLEKVNGQVAQTEKTLDNIGGTTKDVTKETKNLDKGIVKSGKNLNTYEGVLEKTDITAQQLGEKGLNSLGVFAGNIATNIAESFSGFISAAIKGDFDGIGDLWDNLLGSLQDSFADLVGGFLTNPIRLAFESTLKGEGGIKDFFKDLFGGGKDKTEDESQNVINLDEFRENQQEFRLAA